MLTTAAQYANGSVKVLFALAVLVALDVDVVVAAGGLVCVLVAAGALVTMSAVEDADIVGTGGMVGPAQAARATVSKSNDRQETNLTNFIGSLTKIVFFIDEPHNLFVPANPIFTNNSAL